MKKTLPFSALLILSAPSLVFAAPTTFQGLVSMLVQILNSGTASLIVLGIIVYFWGISSNLMLKHGEPDYSALRTNIIWGLAVIFVMVSIWGIVELLQSTIFSGQISTGGTSSSGLCTSFGNCNVLQQ